MSDTAETWLSQEAYDRLAAELEEVTRLLEDDIPKEIEEARSHGDLKENAEYHAAKDKQGLTEGRRKQLKALLDNARVGEPPSDGLVRQGMLVHLDFGDGEPEIFLLGSREDEHDEHEVLSADSPIGAAVLGKEVGTEVTALLPNGNRISVTITDCTPS